MKSAYLLAQIGADTAENEQHFAENVARQNAPTVDRVVLAARDLDDQVREVLGEFGLHVAPGDVCGRCVASYDGINLSLPFRP